MFRIFRLKPYSTYIFCKVVFISFIVLIHLKQSILAVYSKILKRHSNVVFLFKLIIGNIKCPFSLNFYDFKCLIISTQNKDLFCIKNVNKQNIVSSSINISMATSNTINSDFLKYNNIDIFKSNLSIKHY